MLPVFQWPMWPSSGQIGDQTRALLHLPKTISASWINKQRLSFIIFIKLTLKCLVTLFIHIWIPIQNLEREQSLITMVWGPSVLLLFRISINIKLPLREPFLNIKTSKIYIFFNLIREFLAFVNKSLLLFSFFKNHSFSCTYRNSFSYYDDVICH